MPLDLARVGDPRSCGLPVTVPGDVVLIRRPAISIGVGPLCAYRDGFLFHLSSSTGTDHCKLDFLGRTEAERRNLTRLVVRYADGRMADSAQLRSRLGEHGLRLKMVSSFEDHGSGWRHGQVLWLVVPLPVAGPVGFEIHLPGEGTASGSATVDSAPILSAAARAEVLWSATELR